MILEDAKTVQLIKTWQKFCMTFVELRDLWNKVRSLANEGMIERIPDTKIQRVFGLLPYRMRFGHGILKFVRLLKLMGGLEAFTIAEEVSLKVKDKEEKGEK